MFLIIILSLLSSKIQAFQKDNYACRCFMFFRRYIFNWAHRGVGLSSLLVAGKK